jgi:ankyrin repeat protein
VAARPLLVEELADILAFDFEVKSTPRFRPERRSEDPMHTVQTTCSSLLAVVDVDGSRVVQFAHLSVKEYLTSERLAKAKDSISRFYVSMAPAHTTVAQACLGVLLHLDENITEDSLEDFPLAEYAAEHWVDHARFENVQSKLQGGMKRLFDPSKSHLSVWVWIYDPELHSWGESERSESLSQARATPLHYAAVCNMHDIATFLIVEHSQDVNALGFVSDETPLHTSSRLGHVDIARVLLKHGADPEARDSYDFSPLEQVARGGHTELAHALLGHGADANARDSSRCTPLYLASGAGQSVVAQVLLSHGADVTAQCKNNETPLHQAKDEQVARLLLEHGADANALDIKNQTPLHRASELGRAGAARVLLEHGVDASARDANNATPLHLASGSYCQEGELFDILLLLLQYGSDILALDDEGQTPLMRVKEKGRREMQSLLEHAEDLVKREGEGGRSSAYAGESGGSRQSSERMTEETGGLARLTCTRAHKRLRIE